jgi:tetratricopeptide (TPR) repeat protein
LNPDHALPYSNLAFIYMRMNKLEEAKAWCAQAFARGIDSAQCHAALYQVALLQGDAAERAKHLEWSRGKPYEVAGLGAEANVAAMIGQLKKSREIRRQGVALAQQRGMKEVAAFQILDEAEIELEVGNQERVRPLVAKARHLADTPSVRSRAASYVARVGETAEAQRSLDAVRQRYPNSYWTRTLDTPLIRGPMELYRKNPAGALEALEPARPHEMNFPQFIGLHLRGLAYRQAQDGPKAAAEFQKLIDHPGIQPLWAVRGLAPLYLGRAWALAGEKEKARRAYQDFLAQWKDADADIPILKEAKTEYEKLK